MFVTNWISTTKIQKISEITNFFRHYFLSRTEVEFDNCSFYRLKEPNTYLCLHKGDCWEKSFIVFQKGNETRVMRGATFKWLNNTTGNREEITSVRDNELYLNAL